MKFTRTVKVTHVERTVVVNVPARCPQCGAELPPPGKALPPAQQREKQEEPKK